jgi:hypothetical protein
VNLKLLSIAERVLICLDEWAEVIEELDYSRRFQVEEGKFSKIFVYYYYSDDRRLSINDKHEISMYGTKETLPTV